MDDVLKLYAVNISKMKCIYEKVLKCEKGFSKLLIQCDAKVSH